MSRNGFYILGGILSTKVYGKNDNLHITKKQIIKRNWLAAKHRKRSINGERGSRYH